MSRPWRRASATDAGALRDLERAANLVALAHVFPPENHPYPDQAVLGRWRATLADPDVVTEVVDGPPRDPVGLLAFVAYDATTLRHLAVHPSVWGSGLGRAGVERAVGGIIRGGSTRAYLWCLDANEQARGLYQRLGWEETGETRLAEWPPYPWESRFRFVADPSHPNS